MNCLPLAPTKATDVGVTLARGSCSRRPPKLMIATKSEVPLTAAELACSALAATSRHLALFSGNLGGLRMRKTFVGTMLGLVLLLGYTPPSEAGAFLRISVGASFSVICDNTQAIGPTNCSAAAGFVTATNSNNITFNGPISGYFVNSIIVSGNQPAATVGNVLATTVAITHISGVDDLTIDFGGSQFTFPVGPGLFLSASDSASFGLPAAATDVLNFQAWGRATNDLIVPGGTATVISPPCGPGVAPSCATLLGDVPFNRGAGPYALTGRAIFRLAIGDLPANATNEVAAYSTPIQPPQCDAQISGNARNNTSLLGIAGVGMTLKDTASNVVSSATTDLDGQYVFMNLDNTSSQFLCAGNFAVEAAPPQGYTPGSATQTIALATSQHALVNFGFDVAVVVSSAYTTFGQGAYGAAPKGNNPSKLLGDYFPILANGSAITIGTSTCNIQFSNADTVRSFLPQGGPLSALTVCGSTNQRNRLAGWVLALELNVRFSNSGLTRAGLANLKVQSGPMSGQTVTQVLAEGHKVLGGSTSPYNMQDISNTIDNINKNFEAGTTDLNYLK